MVVVEQAPSAEIESALLEAGTAVINAGETPPE
jgi:hypothetical protein